MPVVGGKYYTEEELNEIRREIGNSEFDKFLVSGLIGAVSGSALVGGLLGGSFLGGILGDALEGDDDIF